MNELHRMTTAEQVRRALVAAALAWTCTAATIAPRVPADTTGSRIEEGRNAPVTGTVVAVDARAGTFDLVTGVGYALRTRRIHLPATPSPAAVRAPNAAPMPAPGSVVRVVLRETAGVTVADTVAVVRPPSSDVMP